MQTNYEQIIEAARRLSPEEIEKLGEWARRQRFVRRESVEKNTDVEEEVRKFNLAMKWIADNKKEYLGKWVCLDGDELISYGSDAVEVDKEARAKGIKAPFVVEIIEEPEYYGGGIEMCR
ncbi:MAG: hypothetical protein ACR2J3_06250 [Aridibacter sp.]